MNRNRQTISIDLGEAIRAAMFVKRKSYQQMASAIGMSPATFYRRMQAPQDFTVEELESLGYALGKNFIALA